MKSQTLKLPDFRVVLSARLLAAMALQCQAVIVGWHIYERTHDPLWLGLVGLSEALPAIAFAFVSGHVVDNNRPAIVYRIAIATLAVNSFALWFLVLPSAPLAEATRLVAIFSAVFLSGMVRSFMSPSLFAMTGKIIPKALQSEASAWSSWAFQFAAIVGPCAGGLIYGYWGVEWAFAIPPILLGVCLWLFSFLSAQARAASSPNLREPFWASLSAGIQFVRQQKVLLSTLSLDMFSVLFGGAVAILPIFSDQILHAGSQGLGFLRAATPVGSGLIAFFLTARPLRGISGAMLLWMVAGFGVCILAFAFTRSFAMAFLFLALAGAFDGVSMVIRSTILQLLTPEAMRGRVSALSLIFITSSNEIGAFESGLAARLLGLIPSLIFGGGMTLAIVAGTAWRVPELRRTNIRPT